MNPRKFLVHYRYNGEEGTHTFITFQEANEETFKWLVRCWNEDDGKNRRTIIYSWSLIEE